MKCEKCGADFKGNFCSECGQPVANQANATENEVSSTQQTEYQNPSVTPQKKKVGCLKIGLIAAGVILVLSVLGQACSGGSDNQDNNTVSSVSDASLPAGPVASVAATPESKEEVKLQPYTAELTSGHYTAGIDFPAGTYNLTAIAGSGNVSSSNMYSGGLNAVMGAKADEFYEKEYKNIKLPEGEVLSISAVTIQITSTKDIDLVLKKRENPATEEFVLTSGNYVAGEDFTSGFYDIVAIEGSGNVSSDNMFAGGLNAVMSPKSDEFYEQQYKNISLTDGVTLTVSGVKVKLIPSK